MNADDATSDEDWDDELDFDDPCFWDNFICRDCGAGTHSAFDGGIGEYYMVTDAVWTRAGLGDGMLCIGCLEHRLGRTLHYKDFSNCLLNFINQSSKGASVRLRRRLVAKRWRRLRSSTTVKK